MLSEAKHRVGARLRVTKNVTPPASPAKVQRSENLATIMTSQPLSNFWRGGGRRPGVRSRAARKRPPLRKRRPGSPTKLQRSTNLATIMTRSPLSNFLEGGGRRPGGRSSAPRDDRRLRENRRPS